MKILRINDLLPYADYLPNLGDRALQMGLDQLLSRQGDTRQSALWKSLPWLTGKAYRDARLSPDVWYQSQMRWALAEQSMRDRLESRIWRAVEPLRGRWLVSPFDRVAQLHTGLDMIGLLRPRLLRRASTLQLVDAIKGADLVVFNAGGLLADHLSNYLPERLFELHLAKQLGKPVVLANYSLATRSAEHVALAAPVMRAVDLHVLREVRSRSLLLDMGVPEKRIVCSADAAFALPLISAKPGGRPKIGLMVRGDRAVDYTAWAELISKLAAITGAEVHYLPNCAKYDPPVRARLAKKVSLADDGSMPDLQQALDKIARMDMLITDRYHGVVFAALAGVAVQPMSATTHKMPGLLGELRYSRGCEPPLMSGCVEYLLEQTLAAWGRRKLLAEQIRQGGERLHERVFSDYDSILSRLRTNL